jgi:hypothetical protein
VRVRHVLASLLAVVGLLSAACQEHRLADRETVVWNKVGSWSGRGDLQTSSFASDTGTFRVRWETKGAGGTQGAGGGRFKLTLYSAISGRPLLDAVEQRGAGSGTVDLSEDPRVFYFVVEAADLEWSFTAEEGVAVTLRRRS